MLGAIPNPKKSFELDFDSQKILNSIRFIPNLNSKYRFNSKNDLLKTFRFEALEFLSLGIYADISVSTLTENKCKIEIEISRKIGAFDQAHEVAKANEHISVLATIIGNCIQLTPEQIHAFENQPEISPSEKPTQMKSTMILVSFFLGGLGIHRLMMGYSNWWLMLLTMGGCGIWSLIDFIRIVTGGMKMADGRELV
jgi:hypothetical protein